MHVTQTLTAYIFVIFGHFREELKEKYEGKISQEMDGPIYEIVSRLMKAVVGRRITVPGTFKRLKNNIKANTTEYVLIVTLNVEFANFGMFGNCIKFTSLNQHFKLETFFFAKVVSFSFKVL